MTQFTVENADRLGLDAREVLIVALIEQGFGRKEIARKMGIAEQTVRTRIWELCAYYDCRSRDLPEKILAAEDAA